MFVSARAVLKAEPVRVLVPNDAVQTVKNQSVVFVPENDGYIAQPVTIGRADAAMSQIVAGLEPGERYIAETPASHNKRRSHTNPTVIRRPTITSRRTR